MKKKKLTLEEVVESIKEFEAGKEQPKEFPSYETIETTIREMWDENAFIVELTPEEIAEKRRILGGFGIDSLGDRVFKLPGGSLIGIGGLEMFNEVMKKVGEEILKDYKEKYGK